MGMDAAISSLPVLNGQISGIFSALGINIPGLITQIVSFVVLFALLYKVAYGPIVKRLDQRSKRIEESLETAQRVKEDAARSEEEMQKQLAQARTEGQAMIAQARDAADRFREEELSRARQEIEAQRTRAQADIQRERDAAMEELRGEFAGLALRAAERVVERSLDEKTHRKLIDRVLEESVEIRDKRSSV